MLHGNIDGGANFDYLQVTKTEAQQFMDSLVLEPGMSTFTKGVGKPFSTAEVILISGAFLFSVLNAVYYKMYA